MTDSRRPTFDEIMATTGEDTPAALGALYRRYQPGLLRLLVVLAPHCAEDIASDVWLEVAGALPRFHGDEQAFRAWVAAIARRRVIEVYRRSAGLAPPRTIRDAPQGDDTAAARATAIAGITCVLPPDEADVVLLRVGRGLDVEEVARATGREPGAVRSLQHRALRRLARRLDPHARRS